MPIDQLPGGLEDIARIFPVYHLSKGLQMALGHAGGGTFSPGDVAVLAPLGLWAAVFAARHFRWEPHTATA